MKDVLHLGDDLAEGAVAQLEGQRPRGLTGCGAEAFEEVLVGVGRVELHQPDATRILHQMLCENLCDIGLPGARRSVQHDLLAHLDKIHDLLQAGPIHVQGGC